MPYFIIKGRKILHLTKVKSLNFGISTLLTCSILYYFSFIFQTINFIYYV